VVVEEACFSSPWSRNTFLNELTENPYASYIVAVKGEQVAGYAGTWLVLDEAHITNVAVAPPWRRQGIARRMMEHLIYLALHQGARRMTLEVRSSNLSAQKLYLSMGFRSAGIRPGYYTDNNEDAVIMWLDYLPAALGKEHQNGQHPGY
jgi:ribosomal-protein-alanine N-acetyltransferase